MIELLTDMPAGTVGFRVRGRIERDDYDKVLTPEIHRAVEAGQVRSLYVVEDLGMIEPGALWEDSKLGFDLFTRHRDAFVRTAVVTDIRWMAEATNLFAWMIPGGVRVFPLAELDRAKTWVAGD
jgi:hypothetical protein